MGIILGDNIKNKKAIWIRTVRCGSTSFIRAFSNNLRFEFAGDYRDDDDLDILGIDANYMRRIDNGKLITGARIAYKNYPEIFEDAYVFSVVRNPWDKFLSAVAYVRKRNKFIVDGPIISDKLFQNLPDVESSPIIWRHIMYPQIDQISDFNGNIIPNKIIRFENLQEELDEVCSDIGIDRIILPHKNKTNHKHYTEVYNERHKRIVGEMFKDDIEQFGYKFGD